LAPNEKSRGSLQIVWFRQDLRLSDNPALAHAAQRGQVLPVYILDETTGRPLGGAARWWLHHSLSALTKSLGSLLLLRGSPLEVIPELVRRVGAAGVYWNRCYEPHAIERDTRLKEQLLGSGVDVATFNSALLFEPWHIKTQSGTPFKVFSSFWRACRLRQVEEPVAAGKFSLATPWLAGDRLEDWYLVPNKPDWASGFPRYWHPGEIGAQEQLETFVEERLTRYADLRDYPARDNVSRLSPHLHWGEISPRHIWSAIRSHLQRHATAGPGAEKFLSELGWREFAYHLLFHFPTLPEKNWKETYDRFSWVTNQAHLHAWQRGQTGYPLVDAGMRELWATGFLHNRSRLVVASFLTKHLRIHWREGEAWFWDTLLDADLASNALNWQWVAGSGPDAAPYFRIFNPTEQARKFDPEGTYIRRWCPELSHLPTKYLYSPAQAATDVLAKAGVVLGKSYPRPIVDHARAREAALASYAALPLPK
jgi:deoxyribodipyrimidine photo-lyase